MNKKYQIDGVEIHSNLHYKKIDWARRERNNNIAIACALAVMLIMSAYVPNF